MVQYLVVQVTVLTQLASMLKQLKPVNFLLSISIICLSLKLHHVRFGDLETSLVEMCNCMQHVALDPFPGGGESDICERIEREFSQNSVKDASSEDVGELSIIVITSSLV